MSLESLFSGNSFKSAVQTCSAQNGWTVAEISDKMAKLRFNMPSGRNQILYIVKFDTTMEFSVPSGIVLDSEEEFPGVLSTKLLRRNAERKIGFWCIEHVSGKYAYSCMHNEDIQKIDAGYFARIVTALISECDHFEGIMLQMLN
ncbi:MAG TPA: hypothetical protein VH349_16415 [Ktedonobacterales bacterium]